MVTGPGASDSKYSPNDPSLFAEIPAGIPVYRVQTPLPSLGNRFSRGLQRWLGLRFPFSRWWIASAIEAGKEAIEREGAKLIYASMSPFESAEVAAHLSRKYDIPWVADLRDPWALDEIQVYPSFVHKRITLNRMHRVLSTASTILMNTPEATARLKSTFADLNRIQTITNGFDPADFNGNYLPPANSKFTIVHAGSFLTDSGLLLRRRRRLYEGLGGAVRGVDIATRSHLVLFEAVYLWCKSDPSVKENLQIIFAGNTPRCVDPSPEEKSILSLTRFMGYLPRNESINLVRSADLLFLAMHNLPAGIRATSVPSKLYEYMASGRPILGAVPDGDAKDFLSQVGTALICRPDDCEGMVKVLSRMYEYWLAKRQPPSINEEFLKRFERRSLTKVLAREFDRVQANR